MIQNGKKYQYLEKSEKIAINYLKKKKKIANKKFFPFNFPV